MRIVDDEIETVSFRISQEHKEKLNDMIEDLDTTKKAWFEGIIDDESTQMSSVFKQGKTKGREEGYEDGHDDGYEDGRKEAYREFVARVPCADCGQPVPVDSKARKEELSRAIEAINQGWTAQPPPGVLECDIRHEECPDE